MFHKHKWEVVSRIYTEPRDLDGLWGANAEGPAADELMLIVKDAIYGYTVINYRCVKCNKVSSSKHLGNVTSK